MHQNDQYNIDKIASPISKVSYVHSQGKQAELSSVTEETFDAFDHSHSMNNSQKPRFGIRPFYEQTHEHNRKHTAPLMSRDVPLMNEQYNQYQYQNERENENDSSYMSEGEDSEYSEGEESEYSESITENDQQSKLISLIIYQIF